MRYGWGPPKYLETVPFPYLTAPMAITIDGFTISDEEIHSETGRMLQSVQQEYAWMDDTAQRLQAKDVAKKRLIDHRLLFAEAQRRIQDLTTEEIEAEFESVAKRYGGKQKFLEQFKLADVDLPNVKREIAGDVRFHRFLKQLDSHVTKPTEEEEAAYYEENKSDFRVPDQYKAAQIVFYTNQGQSLAEQEAKARDALRRLKEGESFEKIANDNSDSPGKGGDLGWFPKGHMAEEFEEIVFKQEKGQISGVFQTPFGFHIARLDDHKPGHQLSFEEAKTQVIATLQRDQHNKIYQQIIKDLRDKAEIVEA